MKTAILRGVPLAMQRDGWWLDAPAGDTAPRAITHRRDGGKAALLVALIVLGDVLVWGVVPAIGLAVFAGAVSVAGLGVAWPTLTRRARIGIGAGIVLCLLPMVELVQPLSLLIAGAGLSVAGAALAGLHRRDLGRGALRMWWHGPLQSVRDGYTAARAAGTVNMAHTDLRGIAVSWALPLGATVVFAALIAGANPVLDRALAQLADWQMPTWDGWRIWFWAVLGLAVWPVLVAGRMRERLQARRTPRATVRRPGLVNAASVARSLVAFNALFAVQTGMDILFLYGDAGLPEGITAATYAHRGAYPLLVTALLAGLFAVAARPHLGHRPAMRWLMLVWLGQTLTLVVASLWRLDTYVDIYGLTRLRLAAYVWMGVVAAGLCIVVVQIRRDRPARWMILRSGLLGAAVIYGCAFVNFDHVIAQHNLTRPVERDTLALCRLGEGALPAMTRHWGAHPTARCREQHYVAPRLFQPSDWREWGFRNWRVRRSLAAMTAPLDTP